MPETEILLFSLSLQITILHCSYSYVCHVEISDESICLYEAVWAHTFSVGNATSTVAV